MKFPRIVVKAPNWVGDAVMAGPFLEAVRAHWPKGHLAVLARPQVRPVVERVAETVEIIDESPHEVPELAGSLREEGFDVAFSLSSSQGAALALALVRIPVRVGFRGGLRGFLFTEPVEPVSRYIHCTRHYLRLAEVAGARVGRNPVPRWEVRPRDKAEARKFLARQGARAGTKMVALAMGGAYGPSKRWFSASWAELGDRLALERGITPVLVGGEAERAGAERIAGLMARHPLDATGKLSLAGTAALLSMCRAVVSNDSGLMHVSAALGVPTLGLLSSGNPSWTGPIGRKTAFLYAGVECSPCFRRTCLPGRNYACLRELTVERVFTALMASAGMR